MATPIDIAKQFFEALKPGAAANLAIDLLAEDAAFVSNKPPSRGREAAINAMRSHDGELVPKMTWRALEMRGGDVRAIGDAPDGSFKLGYLVTLKFKEGKIELIQLQDVRDSRIAGSIRPHAAPQPLALPQVIKDMILGARDKNPMVIACIDADGYPALSFRGSFFPLSDDQLALWIRNPEGDFVTAIDQNPHVGLMLREQANKHTFQLRGRARVTHDPAERARLYAAIPKQEQNHDFALLGAGVVIDLDWIHGYFSGGEQLTMKRAGL
jgi:hypothetical protein